MHGLSSNIVLEFMHGPSSVSKRGRYIITSTTRGSENGVVSSIEITFYHYIFHPGVYTSLVGFVCCVSLCVLSYHVRPVVYVCTFLASFPFHISSFPFPFLVLLLSEFKCDRTDRRQLKPASQQSQTRSSVLPFSVPWKAKQRKLKLFVTPQVETQQ